jgi:hypothetical protein
MRKLLPFVLLAAVSAGAGLFHLVRPTDTRSRPRLRVSNAKEQRLTYARHVQRLLLSRRFEELDQIADTLRATAARWPSGDWKLRTFYNDSFSDPLIGRGETAWRELLERLESWVEARPGSISAPVALAFGWSGYAWEARGSGRASAVDDQAWERFHERLGRAWAALDDARRFPERCPGWYQAAQRVALGVGWDHARYQELIAEATACQPDYYAYYELASHRLLPRWYGEPGEWERFVRAATDTLPEPLASEIYARVVWYQSRYYGNVLRETEASWPRVKRGFATMLEAHPGCVELESARLMLATLAGDAAEARVAASRLGNRLDIGVGSDLSSLRRTVDRFLART